MLTSLESLFSNKTGNDNATYNKQFYTNSPPLSIRVATYSIDIPLKLLSKVSAAIHFGRQEW